MLDKMQDIAAPVIRHLGRVEYEQTWRAMQSFTESRTAETPDELWVLEHPPVYTVGVAGRAEHLPHRQHEASAIPVVRIDRGGQITYHGPGQAVVYTLIDLARRGIKVREMVTIIEQSVIAVLAAQGVESISKAGAPGIYLPQRGDAKIAALGLKVRKGCCFHGVSLNVDLDLAPFLDIDPCGYPGLAVTRTADMGISATTAELGDALARQIGARIVATGDGTSDLDHNTNDRHANAS
jgi:lipoyl(octanoyl) transferase